MFPLHPHLARTLTAGVLLVVSPIALVCASATSALPPAEVAAFVHQRNACDAWRAESATDPTRKLQIEDGVCRKCVGKDARLNSLRQRYATQADIAQALSGYTSPIEVLPPKQAVKRCLPIHYQLIRQKNAQAASATHN